MKLVIDREQIEIKVKGAYSEKANKDDAMAFLCELNCSLSLAKERAEELGCNGIAKKINRQMSDIHNHLESLGYFKDIA